MSDDDLEERLDKAIREAPERYCAWNYQPEESQDWGRSVFWHKDFPNQPAGEPDYITEGMGPLRETFAEALEDWALGKYQAVIALSGNHIFDPRPLSLPLRV